MTEAENFLAIIMLIFLGIPSIGLVLAIFASVVEQVDTPDLKSDGFMPCGFDSRRWYLNKKLDIQNKMRYTKKVNRRSKWTRFFQ